MGMLTVLTLLLPMYTRIKQHIVPYKCILLLWINQKAKSQKAGDFKGNAKKQVPKMSSTRYFKYPIGLNTRTFLHITNSWKDTYL